VAAVRRKGYDSGAEQRKNPQQSAGRPAISLYWAGRIGIYCPMLSANENDAFAYAITISDRAIGSIAVSSLKPPTFSAFMLSLSHTTEAPGDHWRKPDSAMRVS
jgi:hypothetical protein